MEYLRMLNELPKRALKRREVIMRNTDLAKASDNRDRGRFSLACWTFSEYSRSSGLGKEAASIVRVFYEGRDERKVFQAFSDVGVDLAAAEVVAVDPESSLSHEQDIMLSNSHLLLKDTRRWEEAPPLTRDEIKAKFGMQ